MATIKSYTTIEQSRKLAEFLSLESADMHYCLEQRYVATGYEIGTTPFTKAKEFIGKCNIIDVQPAWSLAALHDILNHIDGWYPGIDGIDVDNKNMWQICMFSYETGSDTELSSVEEELVDACYEVILRLHERKLL